MHCVLQSMKTMSPASLRPSCLAQAAAAAAAKQQAAQAAAPNPEVLAEIKKQMEAAEAARKAAEETKRELDAQTAARKKAPTLQVCWVLWLAEHALHDVL